MWLQPHDLTISAADEAEGGESRARLSLTRVTTLFLFLGIMRGRRRWPTVRMFFLCLCELLKVLVTRVGTRYTGIAGTAGLRLIYFALLWQVAFLLSVYWGGPLACIKQQLLAAGSWLQFIFVGYCCCVFRLFRS